MPTYTFLTNFDKQELEKKINEAAANGTVSDEQIGAAVREYLTENPIEGGTVTDEQISDAVEDYLTENPVNGVTDAQITDAVNAYLVEHPPVNDGDIAVEVEDYFSRNPVETPDGEFEIYFGNGNMPTDYVMQIEPDVDVVELTDFEIVGIPVLGKVDSDNNVILSGSLSAGTYTVKYELDDGSTVDIGSVTVGA